MGTFIFFVIVIIGVIWMISYSKDKDIQERKQQIEEAFNKIREEGFNITEMIVSPEGKNGVAIDQENKKIAFMENEMKIYDMKDIVSVEIEQDGETISRVSNKSLISRAIAGGLLAGPVGAVIGGATAKQKKGKEAEKIVLKFLVNEEKLSFKRVTIRDKHNQYTLKYQDALDQARIWETIITSMLKEAGEEIEA